jgi:NADH:ubiquinone reductase (H+-translocating)
VKRILILGGGFGGVYTASRLEKLLNPEEASVCLVNRENYFVYQPMLPEVISGSIGLTDVVSPIRRLCPRTQLIMREVENIDLQNHTVTVSPGFRPRRLELPYDYLVIALGGVTSFYGMPGMLEHSLPFRSLSDAIVLRNRIIHCLEEADVETDVELRRKLVTFVVSGGGFSGVEVIAEVNDFVRAVARHYPRIPLEEIRCVLVHSRERILQEMDEGLALFAQKILAGRGVELRLGDRLVAATSEKAILKSGAEILSKTIVSTVPSAMAPVLEKLDCAKEKGRLLVDEQLALRGREGQVWAIGDCAFIKTVSGTQAPPTAQHATREADTVATNISAEIRGGNRAAFAFEGLGKLGALGHNCAIAEVFGVKISGFPAWLLWRTIYLMKLPGLNTKIRVAADWLIALLLPPDLAQLSLARMSGFHEQHFTPGETVFHQGDLGDFVYVIQEGECDVLRTIDGQEQKLAELKAGDYFGEMAVLADSSRNATVRARTAMNVLLIPKSDFDKLKANVPAFGEVFSALARQRSGQ